MPSTTDLRFAFNRGEIGKTVLGRVDRDGLRMAAETCLNWMPTQQGPMMLRPGSAYLARTLNDSAARLIGFVFSLDDTALIELTANAMRVMVDDEFVTRVSVTTAMTNGNFNTQAGWVLSPTAGATATISGGELSLTAAARGSTAKARQVVVVPAGSRNKEHALRITVTQGPVYFKVGTEAGEDDLIERTQLGTGTHSLAFTPNARFVVEFENKDRAERTVSGCTIEAAGEMELPTIWTEANLSGLQYVQSGDVLFLASTNKKPKKIERRSETSWSVVDYVPQLGPLRSLKPREKDISLKSTVYEGNGRLIADDPLFNSDHVDTIFRVFPNGQTRQAKLAGEDTFGEPIRVSGVDQERWFEIVITGNWKGTLTLQHSLDGPDSGFTDVDQEIANNPTTFTTNTSGSLIQDNDHYNNSVVWYRVGFKDGEYESGVATVRFESTAASGGGDVKGSSTEEAGAAGYARVTRVLSTTVAEIEVLKPFGSLNKTKEWMIGDWNGDDGYPTAATLFDGRLWWGGKDRIWGSVSDDYENFDHDFEGDAGPISRSLGTGPVDSITWMLPLARLMVGRGMAVSSVRSSNFDEPLTPTNFTIRDASTRGCASLSPSQVDSRGVYVHANGRQLFELAYRVETQDYNASDLTMLNPDIGLETFDRLAVARSPDTRFFLVRGDGQMAVVLREQDGDSQLASWWRMSTGAGGADDYEDVAVLPGELEDKVYVVVRRTINNQTRRMIEVFARRDECIGEPLTKCLDSHVVYEGVATKTITGLSHLNGRTVRVWGAASGAETGRDLGTYTVAGGSVGLLPVNVTKAVVGLPYTATFKSAKLAYGAGLSIGAPKRIDQISFVLFDTHAQALQFGQDLTALDPLPMVEDGEDVAEDYIWSHYDKQLTSLPGRWDTDARLCLRAQSPRPVTVGAVLIAVDTSGRTN